MKTTKAGIIILLLCTLANLGAQTAQNSSFVLNVDYARFQNDANSGYLEVYYGFYPRLLTMQQVEGKFSGNVILLMELSDAKTGQTVQRERVALPVSLSDTSSTSPRATIVTQAGYALPYGDYRLHVAAMDSLAPARRDSIMLPISIKSYGSVVMFSDLELCSEIKSSDDKSNAFYKNSLEVVPNATLVYGVTGNPVVFHYVELYNLDPAQQYTVSTQIVDAAQKVVRQASKPRTFGVKNAVEVGTTNVTSLGSGKYHFIVSLVDGSGQELNRADKTFYVYNPHIQTAAVTPMAIKAGELAGLSAAELTEEFRKAQYVSSDEDRKTFSNITNPEGQREFLAKFWVEVERGKSGKPPIKRSEYLQRVVASHQRYGNKTRQGWSTDRGRVYILYGDPDEVERVPSRNNAKPHEIWRYYQIENGVQFVFVDRSGFSDYILVHSTKRGELRDDTWERFLQ